MEPSDDSMMLIAIGQVFQVLQKRVCKTSGMARQVVWHDKWYGKTSGMA
jgi:hypothetical protein